MAVGTGAAHHRHTLPPLGGASEGPAPLGPLSSLGTAQPLSEKGTARGGGAAVCWPDGGGRDSTSACLLG